MSYAVDYVVVGEEVMVASDFENVWNDVLERRKNAVPVECPNCPSGRVVTECVKPVEGVNRKVVMCNECQYFKKIS